MLMSNTVLQTRINANANASCTLRGGKQTGWVRTVVCLGLEESNWGTDISNWGMDISSSKVCVYLCGFVWVYRPHSCCFRQITCEMFVCKCSQCFFWVFAFIYAKNRKRHQILAISVDTVSLGNVVWSSLVKCSVLVSSYESLCYSRWDWLSS